jgi:hypothetical protein
MKWKFQKIELSMRCLPNIVVLVKIACLWSKISGKLAHKKALAVRGINFFEMCCLCLVAKGSS